MVKSLAISFSDRPLEGSQNSSGSLEKISSAGTQNTIRQNTEALERLKSQVLLSDSSSSSSGSDSSGDSSSTGLSKIPPSARFVIDNEEAALDIGVPTNEGNNISSRAQRFGNASRLDNGQQGKGTKVNALRHVIWQASITVRYGASVARQAGDAHEENPKADLNKRVFNGGDALSKADQTADLLNNELGRMLGQNNPGATMKQLALRAARYFHQHGYYVAVPKGNQTYEVKQVRLSDPEYLRTVGEFNRRDNTGRVEQ